MISMIIAILMVTFFSVVPIPAEVVMFKNIYTYGIFIGTILNWLGAIIGAQILFLLTRWVRVSFIHVSEDAFGYRLIARAESKARRVFVLLLARILPVPAKVVDISAGLIRSISWWEFTWTTSVGMIPYQLFMVLVYHGWKTHSVYAIIAVSIVVVLCLIFFLRTKRQ